MAEWWLADHDAAVSQALFATLNAHRAAAQELAAEFGDAGLWRDAVDTLVAALAAADPAKVSPLVYYYLGDFSEKLGEAAQASQYRAQAAAVSPEFVFPFQWENIAVLRRAMEANPRDARAAYYLGNLLFDWQPDEAVALWEKSVALDPKFPVAWRNIATAFSHREGDEARAKAIAALERAVALSEAYPTHFAELDRLYQAAGTPVEKRLALMEQHQTTVVKKDEGLAALIGLKTFAGKAEEAIALLQGRTFSIWEGGTAFDTGEAWVDAQIVRGLQQLGAKQNREALASFEAALKPPANLRAEQRGGSSLAEIAYWIGCAHEALGQGDQARQWWSDATAVTAPTDTRGGGRGPANPLAWSAQRFYQLRAQQKLGRTENGEAGFRELVAAGTAALSPSANASETTAPGRGRQSPRTRAAAAHYVAGLGYAGLGEKEKARTEFVASLAASPDYLGAKLALDQF